MKISNAIQLSEWTPTEGDFHYRYLDGKRNQIREIRKKFAFSVLYWATPLVASFKLRSYRGDLCRFDSIVDTTRSGAELVRQRRLVHEQSEGYHRNVVLLNIFLVKNARAFWLNNYDCKVQLDKKNQLGSIRRWNYMARFDETVSSLRDESQPFSIWSVFLVNFTKLTSILQANLQNSTSMSLFLHLRSWTSCLYLRRNLPTGVLQAVGMSKRNRWSECDN